MCLGVDLAYLSQPGGQPKIMLLSAPGAAGKCFRHKGSISTLKQSCWP